MDSGRSVGGGTASPRGGVQCESLPRGHHDTVSHKFRVLCGEARVQGGGQVEAHASAVRSRPDVPSETPHSHGNLRAHWRVTARTCVGVAVPSHGPLCVAVAVVRECDAASVSGLQRM
jgi:hypothetical protein